MALIAPPYPAPALPVAAQLARNRSLAPGAHHVNGKSGKRRLFDGTLPLLIVGSTHPAIALAYFVCDRGVSEALATPPFSYIEIKKNSGNLKHPSPQHLDNCTLHERPCSRDPSIHTAASPTHELFRVFPLSRNQNDHASTQLSRTDSGMKERPRNPSLHHREYCTDLSQPSQPPSVTCCPESIQTKTSWDSSQKPRIDLQESVATPSLRPAQEGIESGNTPMRDRFLEPAFASNLSDSHARKQARLPPKSK